jgi:hypothetical protein
MRKIIIVLALTSVTISANSQDKSQSDTSNKNKIVTTQEPTKDTGDKDTVPTSASKTESKADSNANDEPKKENVDSTTLMNDLANQQKNPGTLYAHKAKGKTISLIASLSLVAFLGLYLLFKTGLCRDLSYNPATNKLRELKERPFSFARIQSFWWTMIILTCFTFFYFYTGFLLALNPTIILLLGGGLTVAIFGKIVDNTQMEQNNKSVPIRHQDLEPSKGLIIDILSDEGGICIHRFQGFIFNIVFGLGFITSFCSFLNSEKYPFIEFEPWQLTLLGISAAGYLGFKNYENSNATKTDRQVEAVTKNSALPTTKKDDSEIGLDDMSAKNVPPPNESVAFKNLKQSLVTQGLINTSK